ncbi:MAG: RNA 2',3'-cyclic phosphodiesterase [Hyphomicrobiales bacterium]|nr:RNA 2',3'-cyclic phosphodiesterase [Hyphomicrobiales bacterium]
MPRLFTGLEIPTDVSDTLERWQGGLPGARWIDPADFHLTLRFIGDIDAATANEIAECLEAIQPRRIGVTLEKLAVFGRDKPHSLVAQAANTDSLTALQAEHERLMRRLGAPPETRKFAPHVTLARLRGVTPEAVANHIALRGAFPRSAFQPERFVLYSSRESRGGGPYKVEVAYPL